MEKTLSSKIRRITIRQVILYFLFAACMIGLNALIQNIHAFWFVPWLESHLNHWKIISNFYLSTSPYNMPEFIGSCIAVIITYFIKFFLDKLIVFQSPHKELKETSRQFSLYFAFAILTTLENVGIQFLLGLITPWSMDLRLILALICGYTTKFFLDKNFSFKKSEQKIFRISSLETSKNNKI